MHIWTYVAPSHPASSMNWYISSYPPTASPARVLHCNLPPRVLPLYMKAAAGWCCLLLLPPCWLLLLPCWLLLLLLPLLLLLLGCMLLGRW